MYSKAFGSFARWFVRKLRNKYFITVTVFLLWIVIFDSSNLISMLNTYRKIQNLQREKQYYIDKIKEDKRKIKELRTNKENLEKFAREQYLMKQPDEEIFIVNEDDL